MLKRVGIEDFRRLDLRHTCASGRVQATRRCRLLALGGWQVLEMVPKYAHLASDLLAPYVGAFSL